MNQPQYPTDYFETWKPLSNLTEIQQNGIQYLFQDYFSSIISQYENIYEDVVEKIELLGDNIGFNEKQIDTIKKIAKLFSDFEKNKGQISSILDTCIEEDISNSHAGDTIEMAEPIQAIAEKTARVLGKKG